MAEIAMRRSRRHDEIVVTDLFGVLQYDHSMRGIDGLHVAHEHRRIFLVLQDLADRRGNRRRRKPRGRDLVQEGLEQVMVRTVDDRDADRRPGERLRREQAAKSAAQDDDVFFHPDHASRKGVR